MTIPVSYFLVICLLTTTCNVVNGVIGINWGRESIQRLIPSMVVDLILQNGVPNARIYTSQPDILAAFSGSRINLTIGVFNIMELTEPKKAKAWVQRNDPFFTAANVWAVNLGIMAYTGSPNDITVINATIRTLTNVQNALNNAGYAYIKASIPLTGTVLKEKIERPSDAEFKDEIKEYMNKTLRLLSDNNAPLVIEVFPIVYVRQHHLDPEFAFPDGRSPQVINDTNGAVYNNVFDFVYDSFVWAIEKAGAPDLKIVVGQVGWPTDGYPGAGYASAERFYKSLLPLSLTNKGTPKRPGSPIDIYVHSLADESKMPNGTPFARHWGIYRTNGEPKYKIDLTGQGRDIYPPRAQGIMRMPDRWCIYNNRRDNLEMMKFMFNETCSIADCTSLAPGGSCSHLTFEQNISYAFNMYFQMKFQDEDACDFEGMGTVVLENPSTGECVFPVEVVRGQQTGYHFKAGGKRAYGEGPEGVILAVLIVSIMWLWVLF